MPQKKMYYIIEEDALPEIFIKVMEVKRLMESGKEKTVQSAVSKVGISRSAFYKYRDTISPFYENIRGSTVTMLINLEDVQGLLSNILNVLSEEKVNILTINQTIPLNNLANLTITFETGMMVRDLGGLMEIIKKINGVQSLKIIARDT